MEKGKSLRAPLPRGEMGTSLRSETSSSIPGQSNTIINVSRVEKWASILENLWA